MEEIASKNARNRRLRTAVYFAQLNPVRWALMMIPENIFTVEGGTMAKWFFEPGHTAAEFSVRHMMVTFVRRHFKDIHGTLVFDPSDPGATSVQATIEAAGIWTGEAARDAHLKSEDSRCSQKSEDYFRREAGRTARTKRFSRAS